MTTPSGTPRRRGLRTRIERGLAERSGLWDRLLDQPVLWAVLAAVGCGMLLLPRLGMRLPEWSPGEVATFDVVMPYDVTVPDEEATETMRQEARAAVLPVYDLEPRLGMELEERIHGLFVACRGGVASGEDLAAATDLTLSEAMAKVVTAADCSESLERSLMEVAGQVYGTRIVDDARALERRGDRGLVVRNLASGIERTVGLGDVSNAIDLRSGVESALRSRLLEQDAVARRWIKPALEFLEANLQANLVYNRAETDQRVAAAAAQAPARSQVFRRGQVLVRRGDTVSANVARTLRLLAQQREELTRYSVVTGIWMLVALMILGWWHVVRRLGGRVPVQRQLSMVYLLMLLFVALNRLGLFLATAVAASSLAPLLSTVDATLWAMPYAAGPATVLVLMGFVPAVLFALFTALVAGVLLGGNFPVVVFALTAGMVGVFALQRFSDRAGFGRAGLLVGLANVAVLGMLELFRGLPELPETMALSAAAAFVGGPVALGVASFLLPVLERVFGVTTPIRLLELSNQNLPLLKQLSLEAPGTYQHSLAVGNLAEAGADAVGANSLLIRVCAYYHDVGKLVKPEYFVENQRGTNPHDNLAPSMSALVIQSHVKEGLEIARKQKLPMPLRQAIATHHGTKLIRYFYEKARTASDPAQAEVLESNFRYPGPKPNTKELGILLLADAVEAAARTVDSPSPGRMQAMIDSIFTDTVDDGQLDQSELTIAELDKVASAFLWVLTNMYHHRIDYPGFNFNRRRERRDSGSLQVGSKTFATGG